MPLLPLVPLKETRDKMMASLKSSQAALKSNMFDVVNDPVIQLIPGYTHEDVGEQSFLIGYDQSGKPPQNYYVKK